MRNLIKYFSILLTSFLGLMVYQNSSALTVVLDGVVYPRIDRVTITEDSGTIGPMPNNQNTGTTPISGVSAVCNGSQLRLFQKQLPSSTGTYNFRRGEAYTFSFSGQSGTKGRVSYSETVRDGTGYTGKLLVISECAGGLSTVGIDNACYDDTSSGSVMFSFDPKETGRQYCKLTPGKVYYATIRNSNSAYGRPSEDSCPQGTLCGFTLNTNRF